jgi:hypothetical protein
MYTKQVRGETDMYTQTLQQVEAVELQQLIRRISALPDKSLLRLAGLVEELIEELEDEEDIAYIEAHKHEIAAYRQYVIAKHEAKYAPFR